jgi:hypothetical protein
MPIVAAPLEQRATGHGRDNIAPGMSARADRRAVRQHLLQQRLRTSLAVPTVADHG